MSTQEKEGIFKTEFSRRKLLIAAVLSVPGSIFGGSLIAYTLYRLAELQPTNLESPFLDYLEPIISFAEKERQRRLEADPNFYHYIDRELNRDRLNLLLFIEGETYEPPITKRRTIGSHTLISLNIKTGLGDRISWTHDLRAPEIERYLQRRDQHDGKAKRIDEAYQYGGFDLMRQTVENATGLVVDFQLTADDSLIVGLIDNVTNGINLVNPKKFRANQIYFQGLEYPARDFTEGEESIDGITALQYIKSVPIDDQNPIIEHNPRKYRAMSALQERVTQPLNFVRLLFFLRAQMENGVLKMDDQLYQALFRGENIGSLPETINYLLRGGKISALLPKNRKDIYLVDIKSEDGGMRWVNADATINPITKSDIDKGVYLPELGMEVPAGDVTFKANPYEEDLISGYWKPLRERVKELLVDFDQDKPTLLR